MNNEIKTTYCDGNEKCDFTNNVLELYHYRSSDYVINGFKNLLESDLLMKTIILDLCHIDIDFVENFGPLISKIETLEYVKIDFCEFDETSDAELMNYVNKNHNINRLHFFGNLNPVNIVKFNGNYEYIIIFNLVDTNIRQFIEDIQDNKNLKSLSLNNCSIDDSGLEIINEYIGNNNILKKLYLNGIFFNEANIINFSENIKKNTSLKKLKILISCRYIGEIFNALSGNKFLESVKICNSLPSHVDFDIVNMIKNNNTIKKLSIKNIKIYDIKPLFTSLNTNTTLKHFAIENEEIIIPCCLKNNTLKSLKLCGKIDKNGLTNLSRFLKYDSVLKNLHINIKLDKIHEFDMTNIISALEFNNTLTTLTMYCRNPDLNGMDKLSNMLQYNNTLKKLTFESKNNGTTIQIMRDIIESLKVNNTLTYLDINPINKNEIIENAKIMLETNYALEYFCGINELDDLLTQESRQMRANRSRMKPAKH